MLDTFLSGPFVPFTLSLALLFGLLALELVSLLIGGSLIGDNSEVEGPDFDAELDLDIDAADFDLADLDMADLDGFDVETLELDGFDADAAELDVDAGNLAVEAATSPLGWLGLGKMPTLIWLACIFMSFGVAGIALQGLVTTLTGSPLNVFFAVIPCGAAAIWFTGQFGALFAKLLPKTESQSVSARQLGRRKGTVTQGTAARGTPAEVRVTDRYGNTHYLRAEPLKDEESIPQGAEVLVLRHRPTGGFRLIPL